MLLDICENLSNIHQIINLTTNMMQTSTEINVLLLKWKWIFEIKVVAP